ncbi:MAG: FliM/FliN family flagellar motor switch protein [Thermoguttaceae bacterium]
MPETLPQLADDVLAACRVGAEEAGAALTRTFQGEVQLTLGSQGTLHSAASQLDLKGMGLIVLLKTDQVTIAMTISAAKGLVPKWCAQPDKTGESKLATLAQELGMNLFPETWIASDFVARWVTNLADALGRGGVPPDAVVVPLAVSLDGQPAGSIGILWPVKNADGLFVTPPPEPHGVKELIEQPKRIERPALPLSSGVLPPYTRSLLRIKVPVVVTLAEKRQRLGRIVELGPGSIIQFDKSCEEMLELQVGNQAVACGEAVKVGDKFGLRITAMVLPDERFSPVTAKDTKKNLQKDMA